MATYTGNVTDLGTTLEAPADSIRATLTTGGDRRLFFKMRAVCPNAPGGYVTWVNTSGDDSGKAKALVDLGLPENEPTSDTAVAASWTG